MLSGARTNLYIGIMILQNYSPFILTSEPGVTYVSFAGIGTAKADYGLLDQGAVRRGLSRSHSCVCLLLLAWFTEWTTISYSLVWVY